MLGDACQAAVAVYVYGDVLSSLPFVSKKSTSIFSTPVPFAKKRKYGYVGSMQIGAETADEPADRSSALLPAPPIFHGSWSATTAVAPDTVQLLAPSSKPGLATGV